MTTSAEAAREAPRKSDGKFGEQVHSENGVTLEQKRPAIAARLDQWSDQQENAMLDAQRNVADARMAALATDLLADFPDAATLEVTVDLDEGEKYLIVGRAKMAR